MGHTHYWYTKELDMNQFAKVANDFRDCVKDFDFELNGFDGSGKPVIENSVISFNGKGSLSCETFLLCQQDPTARRISGYTFSFCKTHEYPYDFAVQVCLVLAQYHLKDSILVTSDADAGDWKKAVDYVSSKFRYNVKFASKEPSESGILPVWEIQA